MGAELNKVKPKAAKLKTSLDANAARLCCLEEELARLDAAQPEEVHDVSRRAAADQSVQLDTFQREATVMKKASKDSQAEVHRLPEIHAGDRENTLRQLELVVDDRPREAWSL